MQNKIEEKKNIEEKTFFGFFGKRKTEKEEEFKLGLKRFFLELRKRKKDSIIMLLGIFIIYIIQSSFPWLTGKLLDALVTKTHSTFFNLTLDLAFWILILYFMLKIIHAIFVVYIYSYKGSKLANNIYEKYYSEIFGKIIYYPVPFFKNNSLGKITHTINTGLSRVSNVFNRAWDLVSYILLITLNLFFVFVISTKIGFLVLFFFILMASWVLFTKEKRKKVVKEYNDENKDITSLVSENINFAIEVKKNLKESSAEKKLNQGVFVELRAKFFNKFKFELKNDLVIRMIFLSASISISFSTVWLFRSGEITIGGVSAVMSYAVMTVSYARGMLNILNQYIESFTLIGDTELLLSHTPENYSQNKISGEVSGKIEFKNVNFHYEEENEKKEKKKFSLKNISLNIEQGSKIAFVGESGGGKSTTIDLIGAFYLPNFGEILVDNISTKDWNLNDLRKSIAYVSQDISIFNTTIGENISYGALNEVSQKEIEEAATQANIHKFIESLPDKYDTKVGEKGLKLSGGQKQRIAIARAILRNPKILILDEPTSALDIKSETYITESLEKLMKHRTTIIIAHRISTIRDTDKIFVFHHGAVVEEGTYNQLLKEKGRFREMVEMSEGLS